MPDTDWTDRITPYDPSEQRVADWLVARTGIGAGNDPIGFVMASHDYRNHELAEARQELEQLRAIVAIGSTVCGRNNCNCPKSKPLKKLIDDYNASYPKD